MPGIIGECCQHIYAAYAWHPCLVSIVSSPRYATVASTISRAANASTVPYKLCSSSSASALLSADDYYGGYENLSMFTNYETGEVDYESAYNFANDCGDYG